MPKDNKAKRRKARKEVDDRSQQPQHERQIRKVYQEPDKLTEVSSTDAKTLTKLCAQHPIIFETASADHIAYNMIRKKRNISFKAIERLLRSCKKLFFHNADFPSGYVTGGYPGLDKKDLANQIYNFRDEQLMVVFEVGYHPGSRQRQVIIRTAWSELDQLRSKVVILSANRWTMIKTVKTPTSMREILRLEPKLMAATPHIDRAELENGSAEPTRKGRTTGTKRRTSTGRKTTKQL